MIEMESFCSLLLSKDENMFFVSLSFKKLFKLENPIVSPIKSKWLYGVFLEQEACIPIPPMD